MLEHFYAGRYTFDPMPTVGSEAEQPKTVLELHVQMAILADKYGCYDLRDYAFSKINDYPYEFDPAPGPSTWSKTLTKHILSIVPLAYDGTDHERLRLFMPELFNYPDDENHRTCVHKVERETFLAGDRLVTG